MLRAVDALLAHPHASWVGLAAGVGSVGNGLLCTQHTTPSKLSRRECSGKGILASCRVWLSSAHPALSTASTGNNSKQILVETLESSQRIPVHGRFSNPEEDEYQRPRPSGHPCMSNNQERTLQICHRMHNGNAKNEAEIKGQDGLLCLQ